MLTRGFQKRPVTFTLGLKKVRKHKKWAPENDYGKIPSHPFVPREFDEEANDAIRAVYLVAIRPKKGRL